MEIIQNPCLQLLGFVFIFLFVCLFELGTRDVTLNSSDLPCTDYLVF